MESLKMLPLWQKFHWSVNFNSAPFIELDFSTVFYNHSIVVQKNIFVHYILLKFWIFFDLVVWCTTQAVDFSLCLIKIISAFDNNGSLTQTAKKINFLILHWILNKNEIHNHSEQWESLIVCRI